PAESDRQRSVATNFISFDNRNISYFVGSISNDSSPDFLLSGDHNLTNDPPANGVLELTAGQPADWNSKMHQKSGNVALSDGSVQSASGSGLRRLLANAGAGTNRLQMPILGP